MTYRTRNDDDWSDEPDWDDPYDEDVDEDAREDGDDTVPCPRCKREVYENAQQCPYCHYFLSEEDALASLKPWWVIVGAVLALGAVYLWTVG